LPTALVSSPGAGISSAAAAALVSKISAAVGGTVVPQPMNKGIPMPNSPSPLVEQSGIQPTEFIDKNQRIINYLRLSVTDRCNLRCVYCMPEQGVPFIPHNEILTYEEMQRLIQLCITRGIKKIRLTGGEPLVRKGLLTFIEKLQCIAGLESITLTTNGMLLKEFARPLFECGIRRINVSLDTLRPERFHRITREDEFIRVWKGIEAAAAVGFDPIKINVVAMKGINDDEIRDFAYLTYTKPYHIRFIEIMPVSEKNSWASMSFMSINEIYHIIQRLGPVRTIPSGPLDGPAQRFILEGAQGEFGLIGALSNHFCQRCNRLRLTADGYLRGCLFSEQETDLKTPLRQGKDDHHLSILINRTIYTKPKNHGLHLLTPPKTGRLMNRIGG
jgi:cyclic pyranopterin phosphate synthase